MAATATRIPVARNEEASTRPRIGSPFTVAKYTPAARLAPRPARNEDHTMALGAPTVSSVHLALPTPPAFQLLYRCETQCFEIRLEIAE